MSANVIEHLTKQFPGEVRPAVDRVSFTVAKSAFVALLVPSGCGKTTLLKTINRLYEPTAGRVLIGGQDTRKLKATELRRRIGYAIQQTGLFSHMRVEQNIAVVPRDRRPGSLSTARASQRTLWGVIRETTRFWDC